MDLSPLQQLLSIGIVGTFLSVVIQIIKSKYGTDSDTTRVIAMALSVVCGAGYYFVVNTSLWMPILSILAAATTVHALFLRKD